MAGASDRFPLPLSVATGVRPAEGSAEPVGVVHMDQMRTNLLPTRHAQTDNGQR